MWRSRSRGAPGGGTWLRSWPRPGSRRIWPSRPIPRSPAAASGTPRPTRPTAGTCGCCWPRAGCRSAGSRPAASWSARALLELYHDLRAEHTAWVQRIHAVLFHHGAPALGAGTLRTGQGVAALRAAAAEWLSPAGQLQVATALEVLEALETRMHELRHQLTGCGPAADRREGAGRAAVRGRAGHRRWRSPAGWPGQAGSPPPARRSGSPGWMSRSGPRTARARPGGCPGRGRRCCAGPSTRPARPTPGASAPDHRYYAQVKDRCNGKRAALSEARKILRQAHHILAELGDDALAPAG